MSKATLIRLGGLAAILAGILRSIASFVPADPSHVKDELLYLSIDVFLLLGLIGLYASLYEKVGLSGFVGFVLAVIGIITIRSQQAMPGIQLYPLGALTFLAGLNLLVIRAFIVKRFPGWVTGVLLLSTLLGFLAFAFQKTTLIFIVSGILFGISFIGVGMHLYATANNAKHFAKANS